MTNIGWTPALAIGHAEIDAQHQELFRRAERLLEAMAAGDEAVEGLFDLLGAHVLELFAAEERLMTATQFPGYTVHKAAHERFVRDYQSLRKLHVESGCNGAVAVKARAWLSGWLQSHIGVTDQLMGRHLQQQAPGRAAAP